MKKSIRLQVRKEVNSEQQLNIIKLKGSLISNGFTDIIHIDDYNEEFHINSFDILIGNRNEVYEFIKSFVNKTELSDMITIFR